MSEDDERVEFRSALAVAAAGFDRIDWRYVSTVITRTLGRDPFLGERMRKVDRRIRRRVRRVMS